MIKMISDKSNNYKRKYNLAHEPTHTQMLLQIIGSNCVERSWSCIIDCLHSAVMYMQWQYIHFLVSFFCNCKKKQKDLKRNQMNRPYLVWNLHIQLCPQLNAHTGSYRLAQLCPQICNVCKYTMIGQALPILIATSFISYGFNKWLHIDSTYEHNYLSNRNL
jgi:hypothetical protein